MHALIFLSIMFADMILVTYNISLEACDELSNLFNLKYLLTVQIRESLLVIVNVSEHDNRNFILITGETFSSLKLQDKCSYHFNHDT